MASEEEAPLPDPDEEYHLYGWERTCASHDAIGCTVCGWSM